MKEFSIGKVIITIFLMENSIGEAMTTENFDFASLGPELAERLANNKSLLLRHLIEAMYHSGATPKEVIKLTGVSSATLFQDPSGFPADGSNKAIPLGRMALFYFLFKVKPEKMLLPKDKEPEWIATHRSTYETSTKNKGKTIEQQVFTHENWEQIQKWWPKKEIWKELFLIRSKDLNVNPELQEAYEHIAGIFLKAKHSIKIHELLIKGNNEYPGYYSAYREAQSIVHEAIVTTLKQHREQGNSEFIYRRICYLSPSQQLFPKENDINCKQAFMAEASLETLHHIRHCLREFPGSSFTIVPKASVFRHRGIVDDQEMIVEDYIANEAGVLVTERVYVIDVSSKSKAEKLVEIEQIRTDANAAASINIELHDFKTYLPSAWEFAKKEAASRKKLMETMDTSDTDYRDLHHRLGVTKKKYLRQVGTLQEKMEALGIPIPEPKPSKPS